MFDAANDTVTTPVIFDPMRYEKRNTINSFSASNTSATTFFTLLPNLSRTYESTGDWANWFRSITSCNDFEVLQQDSTRLITYLSNNIRSPQVATIKTPLYPTRSEYEYAREKLTTTILKFEFLESGWDGFAGRPASRSRIIDALDFINLLPMDLPLPFPQIGADGEPGVYWEYEDVLIDVAFCGDSSYAYYAKLGGEEFFGDNLEIGAALDRCLLSLVNRLALVIRD